MCSRPAEAFSAGNNRPHGSEAEERFTVEKSEERENLGLSRAPCQLQPPRERRGDQHGVIVVRQQCLSCHATHPLLPPKADLSLGERELLSQCRVHTPQTHDSPRFYTCTYTCTTCRGRRRRSVTYRVFSPWRRRKHRIIGPLENCPDETKKKTWRPPTIRFSRFSGNPYDL